VLGHPARERIVVGHQFGPPVLGLVQRQRVVRPSELGRRHCGAQRLDVHLSHQLAHVLQLAARPSCDRVRRSSSTASRRLSGIGVAASVDSGSAASAWPMSCRSWD
jgi:hypothetical protein